MKKTAFLFLIPLFSLSLTSCSKGFEMINEGEHGNTYSGGSNENPTTKEEVKTFINNAYSKLDSEEYKKFKEKGTNVYLEQKEKSDDEEEVKITRTTLVKNNISLASEIYQKGNKTKKNIIHSDASNEDKIKLSFDSYLSDDEVKHYVSEETKEKGRYQYFISYYADASMSYLDYMEYILSNFDMTYTHACDFNDKLEESSKCINVFKGEAFIKQDGQVITYNFYKFNLQHEKLDIDGKIYFTGEYDIKKLDLHYEDKVLKTSSKAYISLLPYDKEIKSLDSKDRETIDPKDAEKLIH